MIEAVEVFQALRHPLRRHLLEQLPLHGELSRDLLEQASGGGSVDVSRHIAALVRAGLVSVRRSGRTLFYARRRDSLDALQELLSDLAGPPTAGRASGMDVADPPSEVRTALTSSAGDPVAGCGEAPAARSVRSPSAGELRDTARPPGSRRRSVS
jgi:DNA-binding transcriptional ArsR family regulator